MGDDKSKSASSDANVDAGKEPIKQTTSILPKACENCRIRKIRCNKANPCSNCQIANLPCRAAIKNAETKSRTNSVPYQERNFNLIHESLSDIKKALRRLEPGTTDAAAPSIEEPFGQAGTSSYVLVNAFEGESSFSKHSAQATRSAEISAVAPESNQTAEVLTSLSSLKTCLDRHNRPSRINELRFPEMPTQPPASKMELPPVSIVIAALKKANGQKPLYQLQSAIEDSTLLEGLCKDVYFPTKALPIGHVNLMNAMLYFLFNEYSAVDDPNISQSDCIKYAKVCERNFETAMLTYEAMVTPSLENILCLMLAAMKSQENSRPSLVWTFIAAGARLCLLSGYHRKEVLASDPPLLANTKRRVFWILYMMDKILCLSLGRVSNFPDYDIDADMFEPSNDLQNRPWDIVWIAVIQLSRIMGQIYDEVYSTRARRKSADIQSQIIESLASNLYTWHIETKKIDSKHAIGREHLDVILRAGDFIYYSCLAQLYGAETSVAGPTQISSQHFEASRKSLQCHVQNAFLLSAPEGISSKFYCDWIILYFSFTPFINVFTHSIASHSQDDVDLMGQALDALAPIRNMSESGDRLYQVCSVFLGVARAFIQSQPVSYGNFDSLNDSFTFPPVTDGGSVGQFTDLLGFPFNDTGYGVRNAEMQQMTHFLDAFLVERQTEDGIWNIEGRMSD